MKLRLYLDEDTMDADLVHALRIRGADVITALEQGMIRRLDTDHLELAAAKGRALYSFNISDYQLLHTGYLLAREASFRNHPGTAAEIQSG